MNIPDNYDFCGWASKNDLLCADGRIIRKDAFKDNDGEQVPLVWAHDKNSSVSNILGHAILENRADGVYVYGYINDTPSGAHAREALKHGDLNALSIWANNLEQVGRDVIHGTIKEVSMVTVGANPGAFIESVVAHGLSMDESEDEGFIYTNEKLILSHALNEEKKDKDTTSDSEETTGDNPEKGKTLQDVYDSLNEDQKKLFAFMVKEAAKGEKEDEDKKEEDNDVRHNIFEGQNDNELCHSIDMGKILSDAKRLGSLRESVFENLGDDIVHSLDTTGMTTATGTQNYGFNDPSMLFPDFKTLNNTPEWISRNMDWVQKVMSGVHKTPFSRIKSVYADITEDEARARGYIKGNLKKEEVFTTLKRTTEPQTVYKKQKMDRDDITDITDFDVIAWIRAEMRVMLNEEIARAILIGDGRPSDSDDKIKEDKIRPIVKDVPLFNTVVEVKAGADTTETAKNTINSIIRARKNYKGSGNPVFFTTEDVLTEMLLLEDGIGHKLYKTEAEVATAIRANTIVTVEPMEGFVLDGKKLIGVLVNLADYNVGADRGGEVSMFEDFDIDYNQQKYLIETRISGALIKPYSALTIVEGTSTGA